MNKLSEQPEKRPWWSNPFKDFATKRDLKQLEESLLAALQKTERKIMATQAELAADLRLVHEQQKKTQTEIQGVQTAVNTLKEKITELEEIIANNPDAEAIPELVEAVAAVKAQSQVVDDEIPDPIPEAYRR